MPGVDLATYKARRPRRDQASLFVLAFVVSVLLHVLAVVAWEYRAHLPQLAWLDWLKSQATKLNPAELLLKLDEPKPLPPELEQIAAARPPPPEEPPLPQLTFVDVDPALAAEPPKDAKFYSTVSTKAANPDTTVDSNVPKIDGKQEQFAKVTEVTKPLPPAVPPPAPQPKAPPPETKTSPDPRPQPAPPPTPKATPPPTPQPQPKPMVKPQPAPPKQAEPQPLQPTPPAPKPAGDTLPKPKATPPPPAPAPTQVAKNTTDFLGSPTMNPSAARPTPPPEPGDADTKVSRPRTIKEALARRQESGIVGEKMKQEGGVKTLGRVSLNVIGTSFGAYDAKLIQIVQQNWYNTIGAAATPRGKVVVTFLLHHNGRVTDIKVQDGDVGQLWELFCVGAIQGPQQPPAAPFDPWPSDMRRQMAADHREIVFTFFYN